MIENVKILLIRYKSFVMYTIVGVLTTVINIASYYLSYNIIGIPNVSATIIAWILAVTFAFVTNKLLVFNSMSSDVNTLKHEITTFLGTRLLTGAFDVVIMYLAVNVLNWNSTIWKFISNVVVIILNYVASKLVVFKEL